MTDRHSSTFTVAGTHPALPGHFPGNAVVPAVVILDQVLQAAEQHLGRPLHASALQHAKFHAPLRPEERATVQLDADTQSLRFQVCLGEQLLAQGLYRLRSVEAALP